jgi:hypothetical protein
VQFSSAKPSLGSAIPTRVSAERQHCTVSLHLDSSSTFFILIDPGYSAKLRGDAHLACSRAGLLGQPSEAQVSSDRKQTCRESTDASQQFHVIYLTVRRGW